MASGKYDFLDSIRDNANDVAVDTFNVLLRICNNIITKPAEIKYRRLRISNPIMQNKILPVDGAFNCLLAMGFQEDTEFLTLPETDLLEDLADIQSHIKDIMKADLNKLDIHQEPKSATKQETKSSKPVESLPKQDQSEIKKVILESNYLQNEKAFHSSFLSYVKKVQQYEKFSLQKMTQQIIPVEELKKAATAKFEFLCNIEGSTTDKIGEEDCLLIGLLDWFKNKFFKWMDKPKCTFCCSDNLVAVGRDIPNHEESRWEAGSVELFSCPLCNTITRFPRYNSTEKLLQTREGRCGEWANCFTLCCRAMGFESRLVISWKDHVWTEVFSVCQDRWLHCDPCENVCDKPLLYEMGWGTQHNYIIGFSRDDIQDVTWRYSCKHKQVQQNRTKIREEWLQQVLEKIRTKQKMNLSNKRKDEIDSRHLKELAEFMTTKCVNPDELQGRTTGSLAWRLQRGETKKVTPYIFKPDSKELKCKCINVTYNCSKDIYLRSNSDGQEVQHWESAIFSFKDMFRKEESDWKKVYLARIEGCDSGDISWKFDLTECGLTVNRLELLLKGTTFENGEILWQVTDDKNRTHTIKGGELEVVDSVEGSSIITLSAYLNGGRGDCAWQHAQLFRQDLGDTDHPFQVTLHLQ